MSNSDNNGFSTDEKTSIKQALAEKRKKGKQAPEQDLADVVAAIQALPTPDRTLAEWIHQLILETAPDLQPKTFYGMPAYYRDGKNVVFFQGGTKFKTRYSTLGFTDNAALDDGELWPVAYAIRAKTESVDKAIRQLLKRATHV